MTWRELLKPGNTVYYEEEGDCFIYYCCVEGDYFMTQSGYGWSNLKYADIINNNISGYYEILNELETPSIKTLCNCDLFTILMRSGCKCGGK